ncbi:hypothetical protein ACXR0O_14775 [Verrucomicrobiota bacterium sgz303538]
MIGGSLVRDIARNVLYWNELAHKPFQEICDQLMARQPDGFWVISHNEGMLVAKRLLEQQSRGVHVTVQDDQEYGMFARSRRYRPISRLTRSVTHRVLSTASTIDVISDGMREYYGALLDINGMVVRPVVPELQDVGEMRSSEQEISVGHIGNIYSIEEVRRFCVALSRLAERVGRSARMLFIGNSSRYRSVAEGHNVKCEFIEALEEARAVALLANCTFLYAMYPFDRISAVFRKTSLPTKLTTYLKAQRPIFAHTPIPSSLASFIEDTEVGTVCQSCVPGELCGSIEALLKRVNEPYEYEKARLRYYGSDNAERMERLLLEVCGALPTVTAPRLD